MSYVAFLECSWESSLHICEQYSKSDLNWEIQRVYKEAAKRYFLARERNLSFLAAEDASIVILPFQIAFKPNLHNIERIPGRRGDKGKGG